MAFEDELERSDGDEPSSPATILRAEARKYESTAGFYRSRAELCGGVALAGMIALGLSLGSNQINYEGWGIVGTGFLVPAVVSARNYRRNESNADRYHDQAATAQIQETEAYANEFTVETLVAKHVTLRLIAMVEDGQLRLTLADQPPEAGPEQHQ